MLFTIEIRGRSCCHRFLSVRVSVRLIISLPLLFTGRLFLIRPTFDQDGLLCLVMDQVLIHLKSLLEAFDVEPIDDFSIIQIIVISQQVIIRLLLARLLFEMVFSLDGCLLSNLQWYVQRIIAQ